MLQKKQTATEPIKVTLKGTQIKIHIDGILHLVLNTTECTSIKSHIEVLAPPYDNPNFKEEKYVITYATMPETVCEYKYRHVWEDILGQLDKLL